MNQPRLETYHTSSEALPIAELMHGFEAPRSPFAGLVSTIRGEMPLDLDEGEVVYEAPGYSSDVVYSDPVDVDPLVIGTTIDYANYVGDVMDETEVYDPEVNEESMILRGRREARKPKTVYRTKKDKGVLKRERRRAKDARAKAVRHEQSRKTRVSPTPEEYDNPFTLKENRNAAVLRSAIKDRIRMKRRIRAFGVDPAECLDPANLSGKNLSGEFWRLFGELQQVNALVDRLKGVKRNYVEVKDAA